MNTMDEFKKLPKVLKTDIALCALVQNLTGKMTKHLIVMARDKKDTTIFVKEYGDMIKAIASTDKDTMNSLRVLVNAEEK